jgi:hypothetical protein
MSQCGHDDTYLFHHVSDPATKDDGSYAVCADYKVYWHLSVDWQHPEVIAKDLSRENLPGVCDRNHALRHTRSDHRTAGPQEGSLR